VSASFARSRARHADLDQVGIPSVLGDTQVIIALFLGGVSLGRLHACTCIYLLCALSEDVAYSLMSVL
jgi:hypothetical protein